MLERAPVALALAGACVVGACAGEPAASALAWERGAILHGEVWRLWSGHLVHYSLSHGAADALAFLAMGMLAEPLVGSRRFAAILAGGTLSMSLGLLAFVPALDEYRGASGLAMLVASLAGVLVWREQPGARWFVGAAGLALAAKLLGDAGGHAFTLAGLPVGVTVSWQAHALGGLLGVCAAFTLRAPAGIEPAPHLDAKNQVPRLPRAASSALRAAFSSAIRAFSAISMR